jgi:molybdopterin converting factor subunit 1
MNSITLLFFASLKERAGIKETTLELPEGAHVSDLKAILQARIPNLAPAMSSMIVSVNHEFSQDEDPVPLGAEVALFPPVSGGGQLVESINPGDFPTIYAITEETLDLNQLLVKITLPTTGAACFFTGVVRGKTSRGKAHETSYLEYEAYIPMAEAKMSQVAAEIRARWPSVEGIAIVQRVGKLDCGTPTVLVACTAAHRDTGVFEAARYGIDRLKEIVPIWKKEVGPSGESWVEGEYIPKAHE